MGFVCGTLDMVWPASEFYVLHFPIEFGCEKYTTEKMIYEAVFCDNFYCCPLSPGKEGLLWNKVSF